MLEKIFYKYQWLKLTSEQRILMREIFKIPKSGGVEMTGGQVVSDGSNEEDLKAVNIGSMQEFLESKEEDFDKLLGMSLDRINEIIAEKEKEKLKEIKKANAGKRIQEIDEVVDTLLETIANLPIDAQIKIKKHLASVGKKQTDEQ